MDTSNLNAAQKEYVNLAREEVLIQKRAMVRAMGGGGLGAMGGMGGFGGTVGGSVPWEAWMALEHPPTLWPPWEV